MIFKTEISVGDILTSVSVIISLIALLYAWQKERQFRKKEYADRIRHASGAVIAKLERRKELALQFFDNIQPLITDADGMIIKQKDAIATRDFFWQGLVQEHADSLHKVVDEEIEMAYVDLYGYDLILADEPTGELDTATTRQILSLFRHLVEREGITVLLATHDPLIDEYADRVFTIQDGRLAVPGE